MAFRRRSFRRKGRSLGYARRRRFNSKRSFKFFKKKVKSSIRSFTEKKITTQAQVTTHLLNTNVPNIAGFLTGNIPEGGGKDNRQGNMVQTRNVTINVLISLGTALLGSIQPQYLCRFIILQPRKTAGLLNGDMPTYLGTTNPMMYRTIRDVRFTIGDNAEDSRNQAKSFRFFFPWKVNWKWDTDTDNFQNDFTKTLRYAIVYQLPNNAPVTTQNFVVDISTRLSYIEL